MTHRFWQVSTLLYGKLTAAWTPCPLDVAQETSCLNTSEWRVTAEGSTKMTVTKRHGSTVFDRANLTIVDVTELSDPVPVTYEPTDFFAFYEHIFAVDLNSTDFDRSTPFSLLVTISSYLQGAGHNGIQPLGGSPLIRLQEFLATPVVIYNDAWLGLTASEPDMGKSLALAITSYRVPLQTRLALTHSFSSHRQRYIHSWLAVWCPWFGA